MRHSKFLFLSAAITIILITALSQVFQIEHFVFLKTVNLYDIIIGNVNVMKRKLNGDFKNKYNFENF